LLLDNAELAVLPVEGLGGSILGMWPLAEEASYEEQLSHGNQFSRGRECDRVGRWKIYGR